jgi:hypothetical protein
VGTSDLLVEQNMRATVNTSKFNESHRPFYNLKKGGSPIREYNRPDYLTLTHHPKQEGNRTIVSRFTGWLTVDERKGMVKKNAPETEIGQQKLT